MEIKGTIRGMARSSEIEDKVGASLSARMSAASPVRKRVG
jgi:hypothetical protein